MDATAGITPDAAWLRRTRATSAPALRLICLPYAGAGASVFRDWPRELPETIDAWPVQLPGREDRVAERPFVALRPLIRALARVLQPHVDRPFALFGHSMGALIAFELTRELRRGGLPLPCHLLVSAHRAPHLLPRRAALHMLPDHLLVDQLAWAHGTPDAALQQPELRDLLLPLVRSDLALCETYVHEPAAPLECPITAFGGCDDRNVGARELEAWSEHTRERFTVRLLPGDHFYLHTARAALLAAVTDAVTPGHVTREAGRAQGR